MKLKKTKNGNIITVILEKNMEEVSILPIKLVHRLSDVPVHWAYDSLLFKGSYNINDSYQHELLLRHSNYSDEFLQENCIIRIYAHRKRKSAYEVHFKVQRSDFIILPL